MKHNKIILIGMMGSGKSTISKALAQKNNLELIELDEIFEKQENISIKDFFKEFKEEKFRQIETEILKKALEKQNSIISTGGGIVLKKENRDLLENYFTIYLKASPETLFERLKNDNSRPLLQTQNPKKEIEKILSTREQYYSKAKQTIETDNKTKEEIIKEIEQWIK
ncbi:MAG: shikimate kinase [Candidatus Gastranaerophilales bacterium]|nr:shikimate kinase [Candidatus Gastranaerophilales bacterium]